MAIERKNYARIGTMVSLYGEACERGYDQFLTLSHQIEDRGDPEYDPILDEWRLAREIAGLNTIVFSAMCFEAAIYDYAADHLGDSYVQAHLDKLDVLSKWIVVLRLVAGFELRKDRAPYTALKALVTARNKLVHTKSAAFDFENQNSQITSMFKAHQDLHRSVHDAFRALVLMSTELETEIGLDANPLPTFDLNVSPMRVIPQSLQRIVSECQKTILRKKEM